MPTCPSGKGGGIENRLLEMACGFKSYRWRLKSLFHGHFCRLADSEKRIYR